MWLKEDPEDQHTQLEFFLETFFPFRDLAAFGFSVSLKSLLDQISLNVIFWIICYFPKCVKKKQKQRRSTNTFNNSVQIPQVSKVSEAALGEAYIC